MIRNKAITWERVTAEEGRKASETAHIVFPNRESEWNDVLERAVHNDHMYGALDASRAAGRIDQEYINPRDRKSTPWADQQWNMKKVATEVFRRSTIMDEHRRETGQICLIGMITWFVVSLVTRTAGHMTVRAVRVNAQTGQCIP